MSTTTTSKPKKDHGLMRFNPPPEPKPIWIPLSLRNLTILNYGGDYNDPDFSAKHYGWHPMVALRTVSLCGRRIEEGENFTAPGNVGVDLAHHRDADFLDPDGRKEREIAFEQTRAELAKPVDWQNEAAFQPAPPKRRANFR